MRSKRSEDLESTKTIFRKYLGSYFQMSRELDPEECKAYRASRRQRDQWAKEYFSELFELLENSPSEAEAFKCFWMATKLLQAMIHPAESLQKLAKYAIENKEKHDSFTQMLFAEILMCAIDDLTLSLKLSWQTKRKIKKMAVDLLTEMLEQPLQLSAETLENELLKDASRSSAMKERIQRNLEKWS